MPADEVYKTPQPDSGGDRENGCNCWIEVLDAEVEILDPNSPYFFFRFSTNQTCETSCPYFLAEYWSGDICFTCDFPQECCNTWELFPENSILPNCEIPPYSYMQLQTFALAYNDFCDLQSEGVNVEITFRIGCAEVCVPGAWNPVYSDPVTLYSNNYQNNIIMSLGGCGCDPLIPF